MMLWKLAKGKEPECLNENKLVDRCFGVHFCEHGHLDYVTFAVEAEDGTRYEFQVGPDEIGAMDDFVAQVQEAREGRDNGTTTH